MSCHLLLAGQLWLWKRLSNSNWWNSGRGCAGRPSRTSAVYLSNHRGVHRCDGEHEWYKVKVATSPDWYHMTVLLNRGGTVLQVELGSVVAQRGHGQDRRPHLCHHEGEACEHEVALVRGEPDLHHTDAVDPELLAARGVQLQLCRRRCHVDVRCKVQRAHRPASTGIC